MANQVKSKQRVSEHGEVFTADREVNAMLDLVKNETERVDSRFLEPACGDGNFLAAILVRKLATAIKRATPPKRKTPRPIEYEKQSLLAVASIYGVDLLIDNVEICRKRLFDIWNESYTSICRKEANDECREAITFILSRNIVCGNALSLKMVDSQGKDIDLPIIFSEWSFLTGNNIQRKDYRFDKLLAGDYEPVTDTKKKRIISVNVEHETTQISLFNNDIININNDEGEFVNSFVSNYRRVQDCGN